VDVGSFIIKNRKKGIFAIILITLLFISIISIKGIKYEFDEKGFTPSNIVVKTNERIKKEYSNEYPVPSLVIAKNGNILDKKNLVEMLEIEKRVYENISIEPFSIADVLSSIFLSIGNISTHDYENKIMAMKNVDNKDIKSLLNLPFFPRQYIALLLSEDFDGEKAEAAIISISLNGSLLLDEKAAKENESILYGIMERDDENLHVSVLGGETILTNIMKENTRSLSLLLPLSLLLLIMVLAFTYRSVRDMLMSLLGLLLTIIWMMGFGSLMGYSFDPLITSIPVLMVGLGIDYAIHIRRRINEENEIKAVGSVFISLLLSAITTTIAFLSNIISDIPTLQHFALMSSFAIFSCFFIMLFLMSYEGGKKRKTSLKKIAISIKKYRGSIIIFAILITLIMAYSARGIEAEFNITNFLPEKMDISKDIKYMINHFKVIQGEEAVVVIQGNISSPSILKKIKEVEDNIKDDRYVTEYGITSILSLMRDYATKSTYDTRYNESFAKLYEKYFEEDLPRESTTWKEIQELYGLLYSISPSDARRFLHRGYDECLIRVKTNTGKTEENITLLYSQLKEDVAPMQNMGNVIISGGVISGYIILKAFRSSQMESLIITLLLSMIILIFVFYMKGKSFLLGLISTVPVILSAIWIMGTMAILGIPLTITTITVTSLAVGLGIDYSIHIMHRFIEERDEEKVIYSTGPALLGSALTTISAFGLLSFSFLPPLRMFGMAVSIAIFYAFISAVLILPAIMEWVSSSDFLK